MFRKNDAMSRNFVTSKLIYRWKMYNFFVFNLRGKRESGVDSIDSICHCIGIIIVTRSQLLFTCSVKRKRESRMQTN